MAYRYMNCISSVLLAFMSMLFMCQSVADPCGDSVDSSRKDDGITRKDIAYKFNYTCFNLTATLYLVKNAITGEYTLRQGSPELRGISGGNGAREVVPISPRLKNKFNLPKDTYEYDCKTNVEVFDFANKSVNKCQSCSQIFCTHQPRFQVVFTMSAVAKKYIQIDSERQLDRKITYLFKKEFNIYIPNGCEDPAKLPANIHDPDDESGITCTIIEDKHYGEPLERDLGTDTNGK